MSIVDFTKTHIMLQNAYTKFIYYYHGEAPMHHTKFNLKQLVRQLGVKNNRDYGYLYIAQASGLSRFTVASIANGDSIRIELRTLDKLLDFFSAEGMPITLDQLFVVSRDD